MPMNLPERLGKYPVTGVLGKGAMGVVYRGVDPVIRRAVAIKTIRKELIDDDDRAGSAAGRFRREAQAAGALNHPGIVSVYEYGEDADHAFIAMEYVEGETLRDYLARGVAFDERDAVSIMAQLLDALGYAHERAVWHRDIKPANIIVMRDGRIKLTDFGIARIESADRTHLNVIMGTPGYIAPEQYLGQPTDHRLDLFSTGVLFYQLSARSSPFRGRAEAIMHDVCYHDPEPASTVDPDHRWPKYDPIIARALAKSPDDRWPGAAALRAAILEAWAQPVSGAIAETTIVATIARPAGPDPGTPSLPKTTPIGGTTTPPPTGWSAPVLAGVEIELARFVGPVARVLVRRAARGCKDVESLVAALLETLDKPADREAFRRAVLGRSGGTATRTIATAAGSQPPAPAPRTAPGVAMTAAELERATKLLTQYIGPIARVVARRAAGDGVSRRDFLERVALSLDDATQRERFLREAASG